MKKYAVNGLSQSGTGPDTATTIIGSSTIRGLISELTVGLRTAPNATDQQVRFAVGTTTTVGTTTSATPKPLDPADPVAATCTAGIIATAEPTYGATFYLDTDINQRGMYRWVGEVGFELAGAATTSNTVACKMISSTSNIVMSNPVHYKE